MTEKRAFRRVSTQLQALERFLTEPEDEVSVVSPEQLEAVLQAAGIRSDALLMEVRAWVAAGKTPQEDTIRQEGAMSQEVTLMKRYNDAFNRHDTEAVVACFDNQAVIVMPHGRRIEGTEAIRHYYASLYTTFDGAACTIRNALGGNGTGSLETLFTGTRAGIAHPIRVLGTEVFTFRDDRIVELRLYPDSSA
jgi:ketosteroid isomerase-like protein